jgi:hypothetical protein
VAVAAHQPGPGEPARGQRDVLERQVGGRGDLLDRAGAQRERGDDLEPHRVGQQPDDRPCGPVRPRLCTHASTVSAHQRAGRGVPRGAW